jgi:hypothetical protein
MAAKKKATKVSPSGVTFDDLRPLFGKPWDDPQVVAVLTRAGTKFQKPDDGRSYAVAKKGGFELLARRPPGAKRGAPLVVSVVFLYAEGQSGHNQFPEPPFGLAFTTRAELLAKMPPPKCSSLIGEGDVPVDAPEVDCDDWMLDGLRVSANYVQAVVRSIYVELQSD